jgi:hypothetical protein
MVEEVEDPFVAVLAAHKPGGGATCLCGWAADRRTAFREGGDVPTQHRAHVAAALRAAEPAPAADPLADRLGEVELWIDRLSYVADSEHVRELLRKRRGELRAARNGVGVLDTESRGVVE